jgi:hypothetical protein
MTKRHQGRLDPDDVLRGRVRPSAPALCALIRAVNPTGADVPAAERSRRYALKTRLQSLLVLRFADEIDATPDDAAGEGVVVLRHTPTDTTAGHAIVAELDEEARSRVQRRLDLRALPSEPPPVAAGPSGARRGPPEQSLRPPAGQGAASVEDLLRAAREAGEEYDFERARSLLEEALQRSRGAAGAAAALLDLLVEQLGADADALGVRGSLAADALADPDVRRRLALAAARTRDRETALAFSRGAREADAASVRAVLCRSAVETGELDLAAGDLAATRALDPSHPELRALDEALARARAAQRRPLEDRFVQLVREGRFDEAEPLAADPALAAAPGPELRKALRALDEHRKRARTAALVEAAERALGSGEPQKAIGLLRQVLAERPDGDTSAIERLLAKAESEEQARADQAAIAAVLPLLATADATEGLVAYLGLSPEARARVRTLSPRAELSWLDETGVTGGGAKARAAAAAALALRRAELLADGDPAAALELLHQHARSLEGVRAARSVSQRAEAARRARLREEARRRLERAREIVGPMLTGDEDPHVVAARTADDEREALALLSEETIQRLPDADQAEARALRRRAEGALADRRFADHVGQMVDKADVHQARASVEAFLQRAGAGNDSTATEDVAARTRDAVDALIQRRFRVCVAGEGSRELAARGLAAAALTSEPLPDPDPAGISFLNDQGPHPGTAGGRHLVHAEARVPLVICRTLDVSAAPARLLQLALVQPPQPMHHVVPWLTPSRLVLVDARGAILVLSRPDLRVLAWRPPPGLSSQRLPELDMRASMAQITVSPDGRFVWLFEALSRGSMRLRIVDVDRAAVVRDSSVSSTNMKLENVAGAAGVEVVVIGDPEGTVALHRADGSPVDGGVFALHVLAGSVTAHPRGGVFALAIERPEGPFGAVRLVPGGAPAVPVPLSGLSEGLVYGAVSHVEAGLVFVLHELDLARSLFAIRTGEDGAEVLYRVAVPSRSIFVADDETHRPSLLVRSRGVLRAVPLGASPPDLSFCPDLGAYVDIPACRHIGVRCHDWLGPRPENVARLMRLVSNAPNDSPAFVDIARRNDPDELYDMARAMERAGAVNEALKLDTYALRKHPHHPLHQLHSARNYANVGSWTKVRLALEGFDELRVPDATARHFAHLLGTALLYEGRHEEAHRVLLRGKVRPGRCDLEALLVVAAPAGAVEDVLPAQRTLLDLLRRIDAADERFAAGDAARALAILDDVLVWEACEVQSMARLVRAMLGVEDRSPAFLVRKLLACLRFADLEIDKGPFRRELFLRRQLDVEELFLLRQEAATWAQGQQREMLAGFDQGAR